LVGIDIQIADLGGATLGLASGHTIWLDDNAAGWGWFLDATPADDSEFLTPGDQGEQDRMDLVTALMHEIGHLLGHEHEDDGVMAPTLASGERQDIDQAIPLEPAHEEAEPVAVTEGHALWLDESAAGWGWFVDATPGEDSEFTTPGDQGEQERMDLLTVLMHELGHLLGMEHEDEGVMAETLSPGTRNLDPDAAPPVVTPPADGFRPAATDRAEKAGARAPATPIASAPMAVTDETFSSWAEWQQLSLALARSEDKDR
jgi:hypothetical protein